MGLTVCVHALIFDNFPWISFLLLCNLHECLGVFFSP